MDISQAIRSRKGYAPTFENGCVMLQTTPVVVDFEGINIYEPKNPDHFWLGVSKISHITLHHGFDLSQYVSKEEWTSDIEKLMLDKDKIIGTEIETTPYFFSKNPSLLDEEDHYIVMLTVNVTKEMIKFRSLLMATFPHITTFPTWSPHVTVASVKTEKDRDELMKRLEGKKIKVTELLVGFNKR